MKRALLALILALPLAVSAQFRIVGTGLFTTLNDSTYRAKIDFRPDLTGNSYNATQLNDSMLVLSQKGQLYRLDSFYNASFSSAFIIVVEKNGNWGSPVGQVMVFQNNSSLAAPQAVYGANGATAGMQAGVDTWNSLLLKVVSDSAVYWNQAYSNSIDSLNVSGDSLKTITLYRAGGDSISATFVDGGGSGGGGPVTDTLTGEVKGPLDSTYIDTVANIIFTTTTDTTVGVGELEYNDTQGSLVQGLKGGNVTNVIGQQIHQRVTNATGAPLTKGTAVFLHGSQGNRITVRKALATADSTSANTFGIVAESIADNQSGYVITEGLITNINTNALTEGAAVYLSPTVAGELTTTKPQAPQHTVYIGVCVKQNAGSGELFVKIRNGQELDELHDVRIDSPVSNASLYYNTSESVWRDTTAAALKSDISGTTNYLAKFTGSNAVGNSVAFNTGRNLYINSTQDNSASSLSNSFQFNGYGSNAFDQPSIGVFGNTGTNPNHRPYLAMYRSFGDTANSKTLVPYNSYLGSIVWHGADGVNLASRGAEIGAITDSITGATDMPTALFFGTTTNGAASPTERMRITSPGNVGINTTTPAYRLDVNGDVNTTGMYKKSGTDIISGTTNRLAMFTGSNTVGNGPISRQSDTLNFVNDAGYAAFRMVNTSGGSSSSTFAGWPNGTRYIGRFGGSYEGFSFGDNSGATQNSAAMQLTTWVGSNNRYYSTRFRVNSTGDFGLFLSPEATDANPTYSATPHLMILNGGNVGIGTASPGSYLLNLRDSIGFSGNGMYFSSTNGGTANPGGYIIGTKLGSWGTRLDIWLRDAGGSLTERAVSITGGGGAGGSIGINTASPSRPLHVAGTTAIRIPVGTTSDRGTSANGDIRYNTTNANFEWHTGTAWREPVNAARSPAAGLANRFSKFDANGLLDTSAVLTQSNGRIGINVTPTEQLQVGGTVRATRFNVNTFSTQVVSINNFAPTGADGGNLFIGNGGASLTLGGGASSNASSNLGIGFGALQSNTTASQNLAVGGDALIYTTTGSENIAIGQAAGAFLTTGIGNTYIGRSAGLRDSTSSYNIGIGAYALQLIGTGGAANENIAIGNSAGENLRAGSYNNVMIGASAAKATAALAVVTSLNSSVYIGNYTKPSATTGVSNEIAIGYQTAGNGSNTTTIGNSSTTNTVIPAGSLTVDVMRRKAPVTVTGNHTVADGTSWLICNGTAAIALTLPAASSWTGREIMVKTIQPQAVNSASSNVVPIDGTATGTAILPATDGAWCTLVSDGTNWIIMQKG